MNYEQFQRMPAWKQGMLAEQHAMDRVAEHGAVLRDREGERRAEEQFMLDVLGTATPFGVLRKVDKFGKAFPKHLDSWRDATGDAVVGDVVKFKEGVFGGSFRKPTLLGEREITGRITKDSYGADKQQHTFSIEVDDVVGYGADDVLGKAKKNKEGAIRRKARNVYRNKTLRKQWEDEGARKLVLDEKHGRGDSARKVREQRRLDEGYYTK